MPPLDLVSNLTSSDNATDPPLCGAITIQKRDKTGGAWTTPITGKCVNGPGGSYIQLSTPTGCNFDPGVANIVGPNNPIGEAEKLRYTEDLDTWSCVYAGLVCTIPEGNKCQGGTVGIQICRAASTGLERHVDIVLTAACSRIARAPGQERRAVRVAGNTGAFGRARGGAEAGW